MSIVVEEAPLNDIQVTENQEVDVKGEGRQCRARTQTHKEWNVFSVA